MAPLIPVELLDSLRTISPLKAVLLTPVVGLGAFVLYSIYSAFLGPLSHIPGPALCKLTGAVDAYQAVFGSRRSAWIHSLHQKYGPVVRISPTLISINDPACVKQIYGGRFQKSTARYFGKLMNGTEHMLVMQEADKIKNRRGILFPMFQRSNLEAFEPDLQHFTEIFLDQVEKENSLEGSADFFRWFRLVAFDLICMLAYGIDMKMVKEGKVNRLVELMERVYIYFTLKDFVPYIGPIANSGWFKGLKTVSLAEQEFVGYGEKVYNEGLASGRIEDTTDSGKSINLLQSLHVASLSDSRITKLHVATEAGAIMIAGSDTTSTIMTYAAWELARKPEIQRKVRDELKTIMDDTHTWPTGKQLESLPYFNGFLREMMRLWPTLPGPLERLVPDGGAHLAGQFIPAGAEVTMQAYDVHRDPTVFPNPMELKPERWLNETMEMKNAFLPFSYGPRNCVGMNLAWLEIRVVMGTLIRRFDISLDKSCTEDSMIAVEHFFTTPKAMQCRLHLERVKA